MQEAAKPSESDLLKLALSLSTPGSTPAPPSAPSDVAWLKAMLASLETTEQKVARMLARLDAKSDTIVVAADEVEALLHELQESAEDLDIAVQISANGGEALTRLLAHDVAAVRQWAAFVVATCAMNNRRAALNLLEAGALARLVALGGGEADERVQNKFLTALSALTNDSPPAVDYFFKNGGAALLEALLARADASSGAHAKALFLARKLVRSDAPLAVPAFASARFLQLAVAALADDDATVRTNAAALLDALLQLKTVHMLQHLRDSGFAARAQTRIAALQALARDDAESAAQHEDELTCMLAAFRAFESAPAFVHSVPLLL